MSVSNQKADSKKRFVLYLCVTLIGFVAAEVMSFALPNTQGLKLKINPHVADDLAYRVALAGLFLLYLGIGIFSAFRRDRREKFIKRAPFRLAIGLLLLTWDLLASKLDILHLPFFPGPSSVVNVLREEPLYLLLQTGFSIRLFFAGFLSGVVLGVGTGILIGWFARAKYWVMPVLKITGVIPAVAWMPIALSVFHKGFYAGTFLVSMCGWFPIAFMTAQGMANTQKTYFEVAKTLGAKTPYLLFRVALPNALPNIFTGITTANGLAFTMLVVSEMMGAKGGLGYYITLARQVSNYYKIYAAIIIMAVLFSLILKLVNFIRGRVLIWQRGLINE